MPIDERDAALAVGGGDRDLHADGASTLKDVFVASVIASVSAYERYVESLPEYAQRAVAGVDPVNRPEGSTAGSPAAGLQPAAPLPALPPHDATSTATEVPPHDADLTPEEEVKFRALERDPKFRAWETKFRASEGDPGFRTGETKQGGPFDPRPSADVVAPLPDPARGPAKS